jgi:tetratricopeptide (TPR) repeat protein
MKYLIFSALVAFASVTACVHGEAPPAAGEADDPRDGDYHVLMAEIALQRQQFDVAATEYHRALAGNDDPELAARAGRVIYEYGTYDQALDGARHWVDVVPDALEPRRYLVLLYLQQGAVRKSIAHLEFLHDVVEEKSDQGYAALLPILTEARNPEAALEAMGRLAESHDDDPTAAYALAYMGLRSGDVELALTESARALATRPDWPEATVLRARAMLADGRTEEALALLDQQPEFRDDARLRLEYALLLLAAERPEEARLELELLLGEYQRLPGALRTLGFLEFQAGNMELAGRYFVELIGTGTYVSDASARAELLMRMERFDEALALYSRELDRYPGDEELLYARAFLYERMDRVEDALNELRALLEQNPDDPIALNAVGYTLADRTDRYEEAYGYIKRAYDEAPDNAAIVDSMGWVEYRMGNNEAAIGHLRRAWSMSRDPEIAAHLGEVLWKSGDREGAEEIWFESLGENPESRVLQDVIDRLMQ